VDKRSGVSQRLPISCLENVVSNAERRAIISRDSEIVPRVADIYAAIPAITGKLELEYEGELKGAETIARDLIRQSVQMVFRRYFPSSDFKEIIDWFEAGGNVKFSDEDSSRMVKAAMEAVPGLMEKAKTLGGGVAAAEFILEGLHAIDKVGRSEERGYSAMERKPSTDMYRDYTKDINRYKKPLN
jgi:magnesium chelatase subunit I